MDLWVKGHHREGSLVSDRREGLDGITATGLFLSVRAGDRHEGKLAASLGYLDAALSFFEPAQRRLIADGGLSGRGKLTLSGLLAPEIGGARGARWLRSDVIRKLLAGHSVNVDPVFARPGERDELHAIAIECGVPFTAI